MFNSMVKFATLFKIYQLELWKDTFFEILLEKNRTAWYIWSSTIQK